MRKEVKDILEMMPGVISYLSCADLYPSWSKDFAYDEAIRIIIQFREETKKLPFHDLTYDECQALGFRMWDTGNELMLIPPYLLKSLPEGFEVTSITGSKHIIGKEELDLDMRFGVSAYGIFPKFVSAESDLKKALEILQSRASQFESTLLETIKMRDKYKESLKYYQNDYDGGKKAREALDETQSK